MSEKKKLQDWNPKVGDVFRDDVGNEMAIVGVERDGVRYSLTKLEGKIRDITTCSQWMWLHKWDTDSDRELFSVVSRVEPEPEPEFKPLKDWDPKPGDVFVDNEGDELEVFSATDDHVSAKWSWEKTVNCSSWGSYCYWKFKPVSKAIPKPADRIKKTTTTTKWVEVSRQEAEDVLLKHFGLEGGKVEYLGSILGSMNIKLSRTEEQEG